MKTEPADEIVFALEPGLGAGEFIDVLRRSTLAERRPVEDRARIEAMLRGADVTVTARCGGLLVGVARAISDRSYCTYLSDLAVDAAFQRRGIGRELLRRAHEAAGRRTRLILLAAPRAETYYPGLGLRRHESCWVGDEGWLGPGLDGEGKVANGEGCGSGTGG